MASLRHHSKSRQRHRNLIPLSTSFLFRLQPANRGPICWCIWQRALKAGPMDALILASFQVASVQLGDDRGGPGSQKSWRSCLCSPTCSQPSITRPLAAGGHQTATLPFGLGPVYSGVTAIINQYHTRHLGAGGCLKTDADPIISSWPVCRRPCDCVGQSGVWLSRPSHAIARDGMPKVCAERQ